MNRLFYRILGLAGMAATLVGGAFGVQGCDEAAAQVAEQCNLECPEEGIAEGNASISGVARVDAFFGAVVDFNAAADASASNIRARLDAIAANLEGVEPGASGADIRAAIEAKIAANVDGSLEVRYKEPECSANAEAVVEAQAQCDAEFDPGQASVECKGACQVEANVQASCNAEGEIQCTVTEPQVMCEGSCRGTCQLDAAASCEGTCEGTCDGTCSVCAGGECETQGGVITNCAGKCEGMCEGSCELAVAADCSGRCEGECIVEPPQAECESMVEASCMADAEGSIECNGRCEADFEPPEAKAECEATAKAEAKVHVECTPPELDVAWQWAASVEGDVMAQAEFKGWLRSFRGQYAELVAEVKRSDSVLSAGVDLVGAADTAVQGSVEAATEGDLTFAQGVGLGCALDELPQVEMAIQDSTERLEGEVSSALEITGAIKGG